MPTVLLASTASATPPFQVMVFVFVTLALLEFFVPSVKITTMALAV